MPPRKKVATVEGEAPTALDKLAALQNLTDSMNRKATKKNPKASKIAFFAEGNEDLLDFGILPTGNLAVDKALSDGETPGGLPRGSIGTLAGQEGSGKTCLALDIIAHNQRIDPEFTALYVYLEGNDFPWQSALRSGIDKSRFLIVNAQESGEKTLGLIMSYLWDWENKCPRNLLDMVVVDSIAAAVPDAEIETAKEEGLAKATMALQARMMSKALRIIAGTGCLGRTYLLMINQWRQDVGGYGGSRVLPGGNAVKYYSKIIIQVTQPKGDWLTEGTKDDKEVIGHTVKGDVLKNNTGVGKPHAVFSYRVIYGEGVDVIGPLVDEVLERELIDERSKGHFYFMYNDVEEHIHGRENLLTRFKTDEELRNYFGNQLGTTTLPVEVPVIPDEELDEMEELAEPEPEGENLRGLSWDAFGRDGAP